MNTPKQIVDIHRLIKASDSSLLKRLPYFIVCLIKLIINEKEINRIFSLYEEYEGNEFLQKLIEEFNITIDIEDIENLPENGRCFFVANHPFGFLDGLLLTVMVGNKYGEFRAIGNEVFNLIPQLKPIIANVNVFGRNPQKYLTELESLFASDLPITHFPAGLVSRVRKGRIEDGDWKKSFIKKSIEHKRNIVPVFFYGRNSRLFYFIFIIRKILRINTNLELILLPHEIFNKRNKTLRMKIGTPVSYKVFDKTRSYSEWAQFMKYKVYALNDLR